MQNKEQKRKNTRSVISTSQLKKQVYGIATSKFANSIRKSEFNDFFNALFAHLVDSVDAGKVIKIAGFGMFYKKERKERSFKIKNRSTGDFITGKTEKQYVLRFKPSKSVKSKIKSKKPKKTAKSK